MTSQWHDEANLGEIHRPHNWEYATEAARLAATGFVALDQNKLALQLDDHSLWILTDYSTGSWRKVTSSVFSNRGNYDASSNLFPATGGSGGSGAILADDIWYISVPGTIGGTPVVLGDAIRALVDAPAQAANKWQIFPGNVEVLGEETIIRDSDNGVVGKTSGKINMFNIARTFKSFLQNFNTAIRTYDFPDVSGDVSVLGTAGTIAAATSTDLGSVLNGNVDITGDNTIVDFGTIAAGKVRYGRLTGTGIITYHVTQLITPDKANINYKPGDSYVARSLGSGNWEIVSYVPAEGYIRAGTSLDFYGSTIPDGYLPEDGANVSRTTYARLFAAIGVLHGVGDGSTTFGIPDSRRRTSVGSGGASSGILGNIVGNKGGEEAHVQTTAELAAHAHNIGHGMQLWAFQGAITAFWAGHDPYPGNVNAISETVGSSTAMNVMQPSIVVTKIIKY